MSNQREVFTYLKSYLIDAFLSLKQGEFFAT